MLITVQSGSINKIYAFDERNGYAGETGGCNVDSGGICTKVVDQSTAGRRAGYVSISNNNDATCIAWITVKQFDGSFGGAWTGDLGKACGQSWYASVEPAGRYKKEGDGPDAATGDEYVPACTWLDGDHTNDIGAAALKFDTAAYGEKVSDTIGNDACKFTIFGSDNGPIAGTSLFNVATTSNLFVPFVEIFFANNFMQLSPDAAGAVAKTVLPG